MVWLAWLWTLGMGVLLWMPLPPSDPSPIGQLDLPIHFGLFIVQAQLFRACLEPTKNRFYWIDWACLTITFALLFETGQALVPGRTVSGLDYTVNLVAVMAGGIAPLTTFRPGKDVSDFSWSTLSWGTAGLVVGFGGIMGADALYEKYLGLIKATASPEVRWGSLIFLFFLIIREGLLGPTENRRWAVGWILVPLLSLAVVWPLPWSPYLLGTCLACYLLVTLFPARPATEVSIHWGLIVAGVLGVGVFIEPYRLVSSFGGLYVTVNFLLMAGLSGHHLWRACSDP